MRDFVTKLRDSLTSLGRTISRTAGRLRDDFVALPPSRKALVSGGAVVILGLIGVGAVALFSGEAAPPTTSAAPVALTTTSATTTTTTTSTTTTVPGAGSVLNGIPADDPALLDRRAMAIKIDNHPDARPQSGVNSADLVYELLVEGGLSRFIAIFHDNDSPYVGPIRSGRPTDPTLIRPTGAVMIFSGAQPWVESLIRSIGVRLIGEGEGTFRIDSRPAPHNLYGDTLALREVADDRDYPDVPPPKYFELGEYAGGEEAAQVSMAWDTANRALWAWDGTSYLRYTNELPHNEIDIDGVETQIATDVIVVLMARKYTAQPPAAGTAVPAMETVGGGRAYVFAQGMVEEGNWERESNEEPFVLTDLAGGTLRVPPGRPWIAVFPDDRPLTWDAEPIG